MRIHCTVQPRARRRAGNIASPYPQPLASFQRQELVVVTIRSPVLLQVLLAPRYLVVQLARPCRKEHTPGGGGGCDVGFAVDNARGGGCGCPGRSTSGDVEGSLSAQLWHKIASEAAAEARSGNVCPHAALCSPQNPAPSGIPSPAAHPPPSECGTGRGWLRSPPPPTSAFRRTWQAPAAGRGQNQSTNRPITIEGSTHKSIIQSTDPINQLNLERSSSKLLNLGGADERWRDADTRAAPATLCTHLCV